MSEDWDLLETTIIAYNKEVQIYPDSVSFGIDNSRNKRQ